MISIPQCSGVATGEAGCHVRRVSGGKWGNVTKRTLPFKEFVDFLHDKPVKGDTFEVPKLAAVTTVNQIVPCTHITWTLPRVEKGPTKWRNCWRVDINNRFFKWGATHTFLGLHLLLILLRVVKRTCWGGTPSTAIAVAPGPRVGWKLGQRRGCVSNAPLHGGRGHKLEK